MVVNFSTVEKETNTMLTGEHSPTRMGVDKLMFDKVE